jgi:carboxylesterase
MERQELPLEKVREVRHGFEISSASNSLVLLCHGIGGNAAGLYPLASFLHEKTNFAVRGICLPGHATTPEELEKVSSEDWKKAINDAYLEGKKRYNHIYYCGVSLGSLLGLFLAENAKLDGLILVSCPIVYRYPFNLVAKPLSLFKAYHHWKPTGLEPERAALVCYDKIPYKSIVEMSKIQHEAKHGLSLIGCPTLNLYGEQDGLVSPKATLLLKKHLPVPLKVRTYPDSGHGLLFGPDFAEVFEDIALFLTH